MAIKQSARAKGLEATVTSYTHGTRVVQISEYHFTEDFTAAEDKLELGFMPADARLVGAELIGEDLGSNNAVLGLMTGAPGDPDNARTVGDELFTATAVNDTAVKADTLACLNVAKSNLHRSVGATLSANVTAGAGKKITLVLEYTH